MATSSQKAAAAGWGAQYPSPARARAPPEGHTIPSIGQRASRIGGSDLESKQSQLGRSVCATAGPRGHGSVKIGTAIPLGTLVAAVLADASRFAEVDMVVDCRAIYSVAPAGALRRTGVELQETQVFGPAKGESVRRRMGKCHTRSAIAAGPLASSSAGAVTRAAWRGDARYRGPDTGVLDRRGR